MPFLDPWDTTYEGIPADVENINLGANRIRDLKVNIRERAGVDHSWGDTADNGQHNQVSLNNSAGDPSGSSTSWLYSKTVSAIMELFYKNSSGGVTQLTSGGAINFQSFPSGTRLTFAQAAPPTGWTFVSGYGDRVLRFVDDGTGGGTGGSWVISGVSTGGNLGSMGASSSSFASSVATGGGFSGTTGGHAVNELELPPHTHGFTQYNSGITTVDVTPGSGATVPLFGTFTDRTDNGFGASNPHTHSFSGSVAISVSTIVTTTTTLSGAPGVTWSQDGSWRPAYGNVIVGQKN